MWVVGIHQDTLIVNSHNFKVPTCTMFYRNTSKTFPQLLCMNTGISDVISFLASAAVTIKDLITELHDVISWFQLGIYLDISPSELMKIRADHREKTDDCKTEMLMTWLRQTMSASWSTVVRALVGIRMGALAQKVAVKYGECVPHKLM